MAEPRVSVLTGSWNNAPTLPRAIASVLGQTFTDLELIVVDDGSTDATPAIATGTGDARVRHLPLEHMGISRSLNEGLRTAHGEIVAVLDADDVALPERIERQVALLDSRSEVGVVGCRMREVDGAGAELTSRTGLATGDVGGKLMRFNPIPNSAAAYRREAVLALGGYDASYRYAMEYDLWLRVAEHHAVWCLPEVLAIREMGGSNVAARNDREQVAESIRLKAAALRRRRTLRGARGLIRPVLQWAAPLRAKRVLRRVRGQAA